MDPEVFVQTLDQQWIDFAERTFQFNIFLIYEKNKNKEQAFYSPEINVGHDLMVEQLFQKDLKMT